MILMLRAELVNICSVIETPTVPREYNHDGNSALEADLMEPDFDFGDARTSMA
jgi:hypothetical protein